MYNDNLLYVYMRDKSLYLQNFWVLRNNEIFARYEDIMSLQNHPCKHNF